MLALAGPNRVESAWIAASIAMRFHPAGLARLINKFFITIFYEYFLKKITIGQNRPYRKVNINLEIHIFLIMVGPVYTPQCNQTT